MQKEKFPALRFMTGSLLILAAAIPAQGLPTLTDFTTAYTQDFDTLANSGTGTVVPDGWTFVETGSGANATYGVGTGSSTTGDTYSFGTSGSTDRALGGLRSGSVNPLFGVELLNSTGQGINSLLISFVGEQWRLGAAGRIDRLDFQFSLDATSLNTGNWTDVDSLDFVSPVQSGSTGAMNGNASGNRTALSAIIDGIVLADGDTIWFRWVDIDATGSDDGLAIDDFSAKGVATSASAVPDPGLTLGLLGFGWLGLAQLRRRLN